MSRLSFSRLLLVLTLVLSAMLANAGRYVVTYTGGTIDYPDGTSESFTTKNLTDVNTGVGYEERSGGFDSRLHPQGGHLHGTITAKLDWQGTGSPPDQIVVEEAAYSNEYGEDDRIPMADYVLTTATTGIGGETQTTFFFGSPTQYPRNWSWISGGSVRRYSVIANPGPHIQTQLSCSPEASVYPRYPWVYDANYGYIYSDDWSWSCQASYRVRALPVTIALGGGTSQTPGNYLVGQRMTADLYVPFGLVPTASGSTPAYQWTIGSVASSWSDGPGAGQGEGGDDEYPVELGPEGNPFKQFYFTRGANGSAGHKIDLSPSDYTAPSLVCCFANQGNPAITCATHLAVPSGALPTEGLDVTVSANISVSRPNLPPISPPDTSTLGVTPGVNFLSPGSQTTPGLLSVTDADDLNGTKTAPLGTAYRARVTTPDEFVQNMSNLQAFGGWVWVQGIEEASYRTCGSSIKQTLQLNPDSSGDTLHGLDFDLPYAPVTTYDMTGVDTIDNDPAHSSSTFKMYVANGKLGRTHDTPLEPLYLTDSTSPHDSNGQPIAAGFYAIDETFSVWQMYRPPGEGSQFVPVQSFRWHWTSGDGIQWNGSAWGYKSSMHGGVTRLPADTVWPSWARVYQGSHPHFATSP